VRLARAPNPAADPDHRPAAWLNRNKIAARPQFVEADIPTYFAYARQCDSAEG